MLKKSKNGFWATVMEIILALDFLRSFAGEIIRETFCMIHVNAVLALGDIRSQVCIEMSWTCGVSYYGPYSELLPLFLGSSLPGEEG